MTNPTSLVFTVEGLELPWKVGEGSYNDRCRILSTVDRVHPQSRSIGLGNTMRTESRIAVTFETTAGQGAKTAAFIVVACNWHHEVMRLLELAKRQVEIRAEDMRIAGGLANVNGAAIVDKLVSDIARAIERIEIEAKGVL